MIDTLIKVRSNPFNNDCFDLGTGFYNLTQQVIPNVDVFPFTRVREIQKDTNGSIYVGGLWDVYDGKPQRPVALTGSTTTGIIKLKPTGEVDNSFYNYGFTGSSLQGINSIEIQSDGKILVGGDFTSYNGISKNYICRLNSDGTLDTSFSGLTSGFNNFVYDIEIQSDGKIIVAGAFSTYNGTSSNRIIRLNSDGSIDGTFNIGTGFNSTVFDLAIQSDGKILAVGSFQSFNGTTIRYACRLNTNGTIDATYNSGGTGFASITQSIEVVEIQSDGKILLGTVSAPPITYNSISYNSTIFRLNSDGTIDSSFMSNVVSLTLPARSTLDIEVQSDGKILNGGGNTLSRLNTDGTLDNSFILGRPSPLLAQTTEVLCLDNNNKIYFGGNFRSYNGQNVQAIIRLNSDGSSNTCVTANDMYLDLYDDVSISLNMSFAEIQDVGSKNSGYSQTFRVPGTPKNNKFFNYFFDVNADNLNFNAQESVQVTVSYKGNTVLDGSLRLLKIYVNQNGCDYEVNIQDEVGELISDVSNKLLVDLDFSDLNHEYNSNNVTLSWDAVYTGASASGGLLDGQILYPFSHNGYIYDKSGNTITQGSNASPLLELNGAVGSISYSGTPMRTTGFRPSIQIKSILKRIFEQNGYNIESNFFDTEYFNRLYLPLMFNSETYYINSTGATDGTSTIVLSENAPIDGFDFNSFPCGSTTYLEIFGDVQLNNLIQNNGPNYPPSGWDFLSGRFYAWSGGLYKFNFTCTLGVDGQPANFNTSGNVFLSKNHDTVTRYGQVPYNFGGPYAGEQIVSNFDIVINLAPGDFVTLVVQATQAPAGCLDADPYVVPYTKSSTFFGSNGCSVYVTDAPNLVIGSTVNINEQITPEYKQLDFLKGVMTQFNLVLVKHPYKTKTYIMESYDDYVGNGNSLDWTYKLDRSKDIVISPITNLVGKQINFLYQDDADALNTFTKSINNNRIFGTENFIPTNTKLNDQPMNITSFFAPSPCDALPFAELLPNPFIVPHFYGVKETTTNGVTKQQLLPMKLKPRILHYFGKQTIANTWWYNLDSSGTTQSFTYYPLIHHQNKIPSISDLGTARDLNFGNSSSPQDNIISTYTTDTAYERYWANYIEDLLNPDARLVTAYFNLDVEDIINLKYSDLIFVKDTFYRINKIENFNIINKATTKVELVKLLRVDLMTDCTINATYTIISGTTDPCPSPEPTPTPTSTLTPTPTPNPLTPTPTPTLTTTPTPTPTLTSTPTPTPTNTSPSCVCYWFLNESASPINYYYTPCGSEEGVIGSLTGGQSKRHCVNNSYTPTIDPMGTASPCSSVVACNDDTDCNGCT